MNNKLFVKELKKQIGRRYALGGGQMKTYQGLNNLDKDGNWVGFDCCGGIMYAWKQVTGINLPIRNVPGMMKAPWLEDLYYELHLEEGDIIFVDIPARDSNGDVMYDLDGYPVYGVWNHVMTFVGKDVYSTDKNNIITTEGSGGDFRFNPKSKTTTRYWDLESFKKVSGHIFQDVTRYKYFRINWKVFEELKANK